MSNKIDLSDQPLISIKKKGDCHVITIAGGRFSSEGNHTFVIRKEELVGIHMHSASISFYFKTFPSIIAKVNGDEKVLENILEFMKTHLINDTSEVDLLSL